MSEELYKLPRGTRFRPVSDDIRRPPGDTLPLSETLTLRFLDGMYCSCKTESGEIVYLIAWTLVDSIPETA